jgi:hypothetical protein
VRLQIFAVAQSFALKTLQFLPHGQECAFNVARGEAF